MPIMGIAEGLCNALFFISILHYAHPQNHVNPVEELRQTLPKAGSGAPTLYAALNGEFPFNILDAITHIIKFVSVDDFFP